MSGKGLYRKILEAQIAVGKVAKSGRNKAQQYDYATESDILGTVKKAANDAGLVITTSASANLSTFETVNANGEPRVMRCAHVVLQFRVIDADTGEMETGSFDGYSEDYGDKAIYKATTGANKYFLLKFFGVSTGDDPERESDGLKYDVKLRGHQKPAPQPSPPPAPDDAQSALRILLEIMTKNKIDQPAFSAATGIDSVKTIEADPFMLKQAAHDLRRWILANTQQQKG